MEWIEVPEKGLTLREVRTMTNRNVNLSDDLEKSVSAILAQVKEGGMKPFGHSQRNLTV